MLCCAYPLAFAFQGLAVSKREDPELLKVIQKSEKRETCHSYSVLKKLFAVPGMV
jgi:hypothetical protein